MITNKNIIKGIHTILLVSLVALLLCACAEEICHVHDFKPVEYVDPDCENAGREILMCDCGEQQINEIPATGHRVGEWITVREPDASGMGVKEKRCLNCGRVLVKISYSGSEKQSVEKAADIGTAKDSAAEIEHEEISAPAPIPQPIPVPAPIPVPQPTPVPTPEPIPEPSPEPHIHTWEDITEWRETGDYTEEQVLVEEAYDEQIIIGYQNICNGCGRGLDGMDEEDLMGHLATCGPGSYHNGPIYETIHHEAEYETVRTPVTSEVVIGHRCTSCGAYEELSPNPLG